MLNFPIPYPDELVYSVVARAGVHLGVSSSKELLYDVFGSRKVISTVDFPSYLSKLSSNYPVALGIDSLKLTYDHTLFPIYAPFIPEDRRLQCLRWMNDKSCGAVHLALGFAASRVRQPENLRYCSKCLQDQFEEYGEYFWARRWQITGAGCCLKHGCLLESQVLRRGYSRHQFYAATPKLCKKTVQKDAEENESFITKK
mgnify:CR=1 FL=1